MDRKDIAIIVLAAILVGPLVLTGYTISQQSPGVGGGGGAGTIPDWVNEQGGGVEACSYLIYSEGSIYYAKNQQPGANRGKNQFSGTDPDTVIQSALDGLTTGRTWKEAICLKGSYTGLSTAIQLSSYTIFDARGASFQWAANVGGSFQAIVKNGPVANEATTNNDMEVWGGLYDGNGANQATESDRGALSFRNVYNVLIVNPTITNYNGLAGIYISPVGGQTNQYQMNVRVLGGKASNIFGDDASEHGSGIVVSGTGAGVMIDGFEVTNTRKGMEVGDGHQDSIFQNLYIHDLRASDGIEGISVASGTRLHFIGPIVFEAGTAGISFNPCSDCEIRGGEVRNNGHRLPPNAGIAINDSLNVTITGVRGYDNQGTKTQNYCIQTAGTSDYALIIANDCRGNQNATEDISYVGTNNKVAYNIGRYTSQGSA